MKHKETKVYLLRQARIALLDRLKELHGRCVQIFAHLLL